jgi:RNA polymerase sigma-70 factor, ECF subfamily
MGHDTEARLNEVVEIHGGAIQRLARSYAREASEQQDLVQEVLIAVARALPLFEERSSLRTFVLRVAHNVCVSHSVRSNRLRTRWVSIEELAVDPISSAPPADALLDHARRLEQLQAMVSSLKPIDRQLVLLLLEGVPSPEIAAITGLSLTNVTTKISRIRGVLRARLGGDA